MNATTPIVTPLALEHAALLKRLQAKDFATKTELAAGLGRDLPNLNKTLKLLEADGWIQGVTLTAAGANAVRMIALMEGGAPPSPAADGGLLHRQIWPDPANPRKDFSSPEALEALSELKASLVRDGLIENLVVRPLPGETTEDGLPAFMLIAGERRWTAIGDAIADDLWPRDRPIPCSVREVDEQTARRLALVENLQRRDLKPLEEARALQALAELTGASAAQIGRDLGFTERWAQQRLSLLRIPQAVQAQLEEGLVSVEDARQVPALLTKLPEIKQVELRDGKITPAEARAWLDAQPKPLNLTTAEWVVALEVFDKVRRQPIEEGKSQVEVHADARFDATVKAYASWPEYLFSNVAHVMDEGGETGRFQVGAGYDALRQLKVKFGDVTDDAVRLRALDRLYAELGVARTPPLYHTTWLNGPFEISDALRREIEDARAKRVADTARWAADNEARQASWARERQEREAKEKAVAATRDRAHELMASYRPADLAEALQILAVEHPLPWRWHKDGNGWSEGIQDAAGEWVQLDDGDSPGARVVAAIINQLAGHPTHITSDDDGQVDLEEAIAASDEADA